MKKSLNFLSYHFLVFLILIISCSEENKRFKLLSSDESGIKFKNILDEKNVEFNILNYMYFYNGGGIAVGDFNNDEWPDLYFTANQESNKLYLNKGNLKFEDITETSGVEGFKGWTTGVTTVDINNDGRLDIYVGYLGDYLIYKGKNQLFVNEGNDKNGIPKFKDRAMEYGLDLVGFSTQASFFDYDRDGDLDMFMLNHSVHQQGNYGKASLRTTIDPLAGDKLLRNDNGHFVEVTAEAGIYSSVIGYGLGIVVSDVNLDGWLDIYVGNDFHENDYLYLNQGNGTFKETLESSMNHTSRYTMGVDFADINNDVFPDLISTDMLAESPQILKSSAAEDSYDVYNFKMNYGYNHQFARNSLQLNNQNGSYSEIALQAGVSATDWSWSSLLADFDLDGYKDIFISNGIPRRPNDLDYINFMQYDTLRHRLKSAINENDLLYIKKMPEIKVSNYLYVNNHDSTFTNKAQDWGLSKPSFSNGTVYADLDNDGDLDIVANNIKDEAFLYENKTINGKNENGDNHFLQISLKGKRDNSFGIGAKVLLYAAGGVQMQECIPTRGYQSSVDYLLTFGTAKISKIDSVVVIWSNGSFQKMKDVSTDQRLVIDQMNAAGIFNYSVFHPSDYLFQSLSESIIPFKHRENNFVEFNREPLIPNMMSAEGPGVAVGDLNGDGRDDIFIGGGKWQAGEIFIQTDKEMFVKLDVPVLRIDSTYEDIDAIFFDADGDDDNDLFVVSGGNEFSGTSEYQKPRLYINDGKGNLSRSASVPDIYLTGSCVSSNDFDNDGDLDLFIGARAIPRKYGTKPDSYLLQNDGKGRFTNISDTAAPVLRKLGFVKSAVWVDIDEDKDSDLVIAGEWMPITILLNQNGILTPMNLKASGLENSDGWWNSVYASDLDNDGDVDLVAGNLGLNSKLHASFEQPVRMYVNDFDRNGSVEQMLTHYMDGKEYPFYTRDEIVKQLPGLKRRFLSYHKFSEATIADIFSKDSLNNSEQYAAYTFSSHYIENLGSGKFKMVALPSAAQVSTISSILTDDFDMDGNEDILIGGNFYPTNIQMGRYDASYGLLLAGNGKGNFKPVPSYQSGFSVTGESRHLTKLHVGDKTYYLAVRNNDTIKAFLLNIKTNK